MSLWLLLLLLSLFRGPALLGRLQALRHTFSQLPENGPYGLRDVLVQGLVHERRGTRRLLGLRGRRLWGLRGRRLRGALRSMWLLRGLCCRLLGLRGCRLRGALRSVWPLVLVRLLHRLLQLGDLSALLVKDRGRGCVAPLLRFGVFLVRLLRWCQHQAFQTGKTLPQLVPVLLQFPFPGVLLQFPFPGV